MGYVVQQRGEVTGKVRIPSVRVDEVDLVGRHGHLQVDSEGLQGRICCLEVHRYLVSHGIPTRCAEALNFDVDHATEYLNEVLDVDPCSTVGIGWPLLGQDPHAHALSIGMPHPGPGGYGDLTHESGGAREAQWEPMRASWRWSSLAVRASD